MVAIGLILALVASFVSLTNQQRPAPNGYTDSNGNSYYYFSGKGEEYPYHVASRKCRDVGGHLAVLNSIDEAKYLNDTLTSRLSVTTHDYYVGYAGCYWWVPDNEQAVCAEASHDVNYTLDAINSDGFGDSVSARTQSNFDAYQCMAYNKINMTYNMSICLPGATPTPGYICERETDTCGCSKMNEPVIRTFDGQPIQLDAYCLYTLVDTAQYKVEIRTAPSVYKVIKNRDRAANFPHLANRVDEVRITDRQTNKTYIASYVENVEGLYGIRINVFNADGSIVTVGQGGQIYFSAGLLDPASWPESANIKLDVLEHLSPLLSVTQNVFKINPIILSFPPNNPIFKIFYNGFNADVRMVYSAASVSPVKGLCGTCEDKKKLIDADGYETLSTYAHGYSWISSSDKNQCPATMMRPETCVSDLMYRRAIERCNPLIDYKGMLNEKTSGCVSMYLTRYPPLGRVSLFNGCVASTCEFGYLAACHFIKKALWLCGYANPDKFLRETPDLSKALGCDPDAICGQDNTLYTNAKTFNGTCYATNPLNQNISAFTAERFCQENYGHLASPHSADELRFYIDTFINGPQNPGDLVNMWIGRVVGNQPYFNAFNKEANLDGSLVDFTYKEANPSGSSDGPCIAVGSVMNAYNCVNGTANGFLCSFKAYVPCGDIACNYPNKCDQQTLTCYDPCFQEGFYYMGHCVPMFFLPITPGKGTRPSDVPPLT